MRRLPYPSEEFDLIVDKGCLDCLHCSDSASVRDEVKAAVSGLQRCLKLRGTLLSLSHSPPEQRSACFLLDRTEMLLDLLQRERRDKESRRAQQQADGSSEDTGAPQRAASAASGGKRFARASVSSRLSSPLAGFGQPVVLRLDKQPPPSPGPRRSSVSSVSSRGSVRPSVSSSAADLLSEQAEAEAETLSAAAADVDAQLNLSAVEEADHYLYLCTKDVLPNSEQEGGRPNARAQQARRSSVM